MQVYREVVIIFSSLYLYTEGAIRCEFRKYLLPGSVYHLSSPGYPKNFTTAVNCRWIVNTAPGYVCRLECFQFVLAESPLCSDRFLVSTIGDPLLSTATAYCGSRSINETSVSRRISMSLQASPNTTGGRFRCQVSAKRDTFFQKPSPVDLVAPNPKLQQPWFKAWGDSIKEITSQINFFNDSKKKHLTK